MSDLRVSLVSGIEARFLMPMTLLFSTALVIQNLPFFNAALLAFQGTAIPPVGVDWIQPVGSTGLAAMMFWFYRQEHKETIQRMAELTQEYRDTLKEIHGAIHESTVSNVRLCEILDRVLGRDRQPK